MTLGLVHLQNVLAFHFRRMAHLWKPRKEFRSPSYKYADNVEGIARELETGYS